MSNNGRTDREKLKRAWDRNPNCYICGIPTVLRPYPLGNFSENSSDYAVFKRLPNCLDKYTDKQPKNGKTRVLICYGCADRINEDEQKKRSLGELQLWAGKPKDNWYLFKIEKLLKENIGLRIENERLRKNKA